MKCLHSLYTSDYESLKRRNPDRVAGTLEWFLSHAKYQHWRREQKSSLLWVSADPGCWKSVLAYFLVDKLNIVKSQSELHETEQCNICSFRTTTPALQNENIKHAIKEFESKGEKFTEGLDTLWNIFTAAITDLDCGNVICIIDSLDECERSTREKLINYFVRMFTPAEEETTAISSDIERVVNKNINELGIMLTLPDDVRSNLRDNLLKDADRTFLWVSLILNILKDTAEASPNEFHKILNNLPSDLDTIYENILRDSPNLTKAKTILQIVVAAARPLTLNEMDIALAIRPSHESIEDLKPYRPFSIESTVKEICGLFVRVIDSKIYLIHQTAKEFLINDSTTVPTTGMWKHSLLPAESSLTIANICIDYLLFTAFETHPLNLSTNMERKINLDDYVTKHAFLDYAAKHWATHIQETEMEQDPELLNSTLEILDDGSRSSRLLTWFQVYWIGDNTSEKLIQNVTSLMVASYLGLSAAVRRLMEVSGDINAQGDLYGTALNAAAYRKHGRVVSMLLNAGGIVYLFESEFKNLLQTRQGDIADIRLALQCRK
ncbi:hypothetical protein BDD12DRAFT_933421 [Trichophaea hybrida]|nr:hypothetical protein BDD12DRAFT_933421 [Trichophaea hybrida]